MMAKPTVNHKNQIVLPSDFFLPFGGTLDENNRWVKLAALIPWSHAEKSYNQHFNNTDRGQEAFNVRVALGALIIQARMNLTDVETVESIQENPYMQYFIGFSGFQQKKPFHPSLMTHFRKRLVHVLAEINEIIAIEGIKDERDNRDNDDDPGSPSGEKGKASFKKKSSSPTAVQQEWILDEESNQHIKSGPVEGSTDEKTRESPSHEKQCASKEEKPPNENQGTLLLDATCAPADIKYPTDLDLLNEAREKLEDIIDTLHKPVIGQRPKPRTYRNKARKQYLSLSKNRRPSKKKIRKAVGQQLRYVKRNLKTISQQGNQQSLSLLSRKQYRDLLVIGELYRQQLQMYKERTHHISERITSIHQPHIRPIVRGKVKANVEFGAKLAVSMTNGYAFLDYQSWDNFNESTTLIESIEKYRKRTGCYPAVVQADQIYRTRENRRYCKEHGIRLSGPPLGRPPKEGIPNEQKKITKQDAAERNAIEGKFGEGKRKYGLELIQTRLEETSEAVIHLQFLVMNLGRRLRFLFVFIFSFVFCRRMNLNGC